MSKIYQEKPEELFYPVVIRLETLLEVNNLRDALRRAEKHTLEGTTSMKILKFLEEMEDLD